MKKLIIQCTTIFLAFLAGIGFMNYTTYMGNRDMTAVMAEATLPVAYAEKDGQVYNEMHGYVGVMDGSYMNESILGLSEDHKLGIAIEKYNARIEGVSYEVRSLDMGRLVESGDNLQAEDDGKYLHLKLDFKDLMAKGEKYLLILNVNTDEHGEVYFYSQITYLGENHVQECVDFARQFHEAAVAKDGDFVYRYLEPDGSMDGKDLGYLNIHARSGPICWGDMQVEKISEPRIRFSDLFGDYTSMVMEYQIQNADTGERYQVEEAFCVQYTSSRMYLLNYERTADRIFTVGNQLVEDSEILFGIQGSEVNYRKNEEENVLGFVQQGQLWSYDFGQNRLSCVYGFQDEEDERGLYNAHDFRILDVEDSGSMDFLVYGYMNRGRYEGMCGVLLCRYDALMNTVEEEFFLPSDRPFQVLKGEIGKLAVANEEGKAWLSYRNMVLQINLTDSSVKVLAENIREDQLQVSDSGLLAAWTEEDAEKISLLNTRNGIINEIMTENGEILQALGFMEEDFIYGTAYREDIRTDLAGQKVIPMYRVIIRDHSGNEVREFDYAAKGKYVTSVSIVENRIDLACVSKTTDGSYEEARPEPITYTSEPADNKLRLEIINDAVKRNEYHAVYEGTLKNGSMKRPKVKLVLFENDRTLQIANSGAERYFAWGFNGTAEGFDDLSDAVRSAYENMGSVWKNGSQRYWKRLGRKVRAQLEGFDDLENMENSGSSLVQCTQLLLRNKQIYTDVQASLDAGETVWEILQQELGDDLCLLPGCSVDMIKYYINLGMPVMAVTDTGETVLLVGYDQQNVVYYEPGQTTLNKVKAGSKDDVPMFEASGYLFFTCLP